MSISVLAAAKYIGGLSDWSKSNLELQKILYIAHMLHLGLHEQPLVQDNFQAWELGPVHPILYHKAKVFGANPVQNIFRSVPNLDEHNLETKTLNATFNAVAEFTGSRLIAITHCDYGAWAKNYKPGAYGIVIPNEDIFEEYKERRERSVRNKQ